MYDSYNDTMKHIGIIQKTFDNVIIPELEKRKTTFLSDLLSVEKGKDIGTLLSFNTGILSILCII